ncbi:hypothetical protein GCHA_3890 [Paraglaciecola chathamensis S18K6]|uniref:Uncharacterized protein n=1 Tax=Paraglaciecola chathamensis S18K6 TaxID=1127672 RepID=A0AAV3V5X4_9ALTE|nr:hypothetical protein GCHA_3890 [Paraglaciecola chathamensis S18K6]
MGKCEIAIHTFDQALCLMLAYDFKMLIHFSFGHHRLE